MRREAVIEYLKGALWAMPACAVALALAVGSILSRIDIPAESRWSFLLFQGTVDDARNLLIGIASTMVTVIALVLGLTVVALQLASTQYSPRVLRNFLRDRVNQLTLSAFMATFAYSTAGLYTVGISSGQRTDEYPRLAVTGALVLLFLTMIVLVYFVHHLMHSIQIDHVMSDIERGIVRQTARGLGDSGESASAPVVPEFATALPSNQSGYVQTVHLERLADAAASHDVVVVLIRLVGDHVVEETPLGWAWPVNSTASPASGFADDLLAVVNDSVRVGFERTAEQDTAFGVRQLADVASKALSPAVNDPYTAIQAADHISVVLADLARRPLGNHVVRDSSGSPRVYMPGRDWAYYVDLGLGQVRRFGHTEPRVVLALYRVVRDIASFCDAERRAVLWQFLHVLVGDVERNIQQPADRDPLVEQGRQVMQAIKETPVPAVASERLGSP
jgi:uncharacterized membrane protein